MEQASTEIQITTENLGKLSPIAIFKKGGISPIIDAIISEVTSVVPDTTTAKGRNEIASLAHKVAKSKALLDKMGKALADDLNSKLKPINAERKQARDQLDALKISVRQPLTGWEAEQKRIADEEAARVAAEELAVKVEDDHEIGLLMAEKFDRYQADKLAEQEIILAELKARKKQEEEEYKKALEEAARLEAEQKAKAEIERVEREKQEAIEREEQAKRNQIAAEERAKVQAEQAEIARAEAEKQAAINAEAAAEQAKAEEKAYQKACKAAIEKDEADRLANREHVSNFRGEAKLALIGLGLTEVQAKKVVMAIHDGKIPHIKINY